MKRRKIPLSKNSLLSNSCILLEHWTTRMRLDAGRCSPFLRQSLSVPDLPEEVTKLTIEVLRGICAGDAAGEREFCSVVLEAVADVHDTIMDEPA